MTRNADSLQGSGQPQASDDAPELLLDKRYRIIRLLGEGGMGSVHLAEHVGLKTRVAVKFLHIELAGQGEAIRRFEQEARIAASIRHNNIIQVFDVGFSERGDPFLVMEYLEGESLGGLMKRTGPMDLGAACGVVEPVLLALQAANRKGIIHRDLKPENVFLAHQPDEGPVVKIIDFGLSKITTNAQELSRTQTGSVLGTPAYMSPEQAAGSTSLDHRTDLYSVGTMLYEMLAGALPYFGNNFNEFFAKLLTEEPRAPRDVYPAFPIEAEPLVRKAICKNPNDRFQTATEMLEALAMLPGWATRTERLARISSGMGASSFAAGDLGPGERRARSKVASPFSATEARYSTTKVGQAGGSLDGGKPTRVSRRGLVAGALIAAVLLVVVAVFGVGRWFSPATSATSPKPTTLPAPAPTEKPAVTASPSGPATERAPQPELPAGQPKATLPSAEPSAEPGPPQPSKAAAAKSRKKSQTGAKRLRRGGRGTVMSEDFE
jgi:serine/threonine protein kinase